jgi:hypothetical protein
MTQPKPSTFPTLPAFTNWRSHAKLPDSAPAESVAYPKLTLTMVTKSDLIHQRHVTRIVKGARAAGFDVRALRVDKDGSVVLFSKSSEHEECEEPRLQSNEWDEVLKK